MEINSKIKEILTEFGIPEEDGLAYLLSIYFDCRPSYTPSLLIHKINTTQILGIDENRKLFWRVPLFEGAIEREEKYWKWLEEYRNLFKDINPARAGDKKGILKRMQKFFAEHPEVRKEDVIGATKMYISSLSSSTYLISANYFIYKGVGSSQTSALETWVEKYMESSPVEGQGPSID